MRNRQEQTKAEPIKPLMFSLIQLPHDHEQAGKKPAIPATNKRDGAQTGKNRPKKKKGAAQWRWTSEQQGPYSAANSEGGGQADDAAAADDARMKNEQAEGERSMEEGSNERGERGENGGKRKKKRNAKKKNKEDGQALEDEDDEDDEDEDEDEDDDQGDGTSEPEQQQKRNRSKKKGGTVANQQKCVLLCFVCLTSH
jgi:hypothetical protein